MAKKKFSLSDLPIIRSFLELFETSGEDEPVSKERALQTYKIYEYVDRQLALAGSIDYSLGGYCSDVYVDPSGVFVIAKKNDGKMYKAMVTVDENNDVILSEWQEVIIDFKPVSRGLSIERQADGKTRWYLWPACTAALNRSGEIDSRALFDSFERNIERGCDYPELDFFHLGSLFTLGKADNVFRDGYTYNATGLFYDDEETRAVIDAIEAEPEYWGGSIQYYPSEAPEMLVTEDGSEIPVYTAGVNRFISILPEHTAASIFTSISTEGVERMNKAQEEALKRAGVSQSKIDELKSKARTVNDSLEGEVKREVKPAVKTAAKPAAKAEASAESDQALAVISHPQFRTVLREVLDDIRGEAPAAAAGADEDEETETEESAEETETENAVVQAAATSESTERSKRLESKLDEILRRLDEQDEDEEQELRQILEDLPSRTKNQKIVRPRSSRNSVEPKVRTMENQAASVTARMREGRTN